MNDEKKLFNAVCSNDREKIENVFNEIYYKYKPLVVYVAKQYLKDSYDIEDIVQETFIKFFNNIENVNKSIKSFLTTLCRNSCLDLIRKNVRKDESLTDDIEKYQNYSFDYLVNDRGTSSIDFNDLLSDMKECLASDEINIIMLHLINDLTFEQVALKLDKDTNSIKTSYYRALRKYRKRKKNI